MIPSTLSKVQRALQDSFGYQWQRHANRLDQWARRCQEYFSPFDPPALGQGAVLDAGCGYGRWLSEVARGGGLCVGMDFSASIFTAADYLSAQPNCHLVQGDILQPPFKTGSFQTVYSLGVLHYLPEGAAPGVRALSSLVAPGGLVFIWLYGKHRGDHHLTPATLVRRVTRQLPRQGMEMMCRFGAYGISVLILGPKRVLSRWHPTQKFAARLPFHTYRDLPVSELWTDLFDRYATPIEHGYDAHQVYQMLEENGVERITVTALGTPRDPEASWRGYGFRPAPSR